MTVPLLATHLGLFSDGLFCFAAAVSLFLAVVGMVKGGWLGRVCVVLGLLLWPPALFQFLHHH